MRINPAWGVLRSLYNGGKSNQFPHQHRNPILSPPILPCLWTSHKRLLFGAYQASALSIIYPASCLLMVRSLFLSLLFGNPPNSCYSFEKRSPDQTQNKTSFPKTIVLSGAHRIQIVQTTWTNEELMGRWGPSSLWSFILKIFSILHIRHNSLLTLEVRDCLITIIKITNKYGSLIRWSNPYNTPILKVRKESNKWRLAQGLRLTNGAVAPLYSVIPDPCTRLIQIPPGTTHNSVLVKMLYLHSHAYQQPTSLCLWGPYSEG